MEKYELISPIYENSQPSEKYDKTSLPCRLNVEKANKRKIANDV